MANQQRRLILGQGEKYLKSVEKPRRGRTPEPPRTYAEARNLVRAGVLAAMESYNSLPSDKRLPGEAVFCLRLHPDATAKSYDPVALFDDSPQLRKVGSRNYQAPPKNVAATKRIKKLIQSNVERVEGRLVFVQSSVDGFRQFLVQLDRPETRVSKLVQDEIRRVEHFDALAPDERIVGFDHNWKGGRVELVFHPTRLESRQLEFIFALFIDVGVARDRSQLRPYQGGPTFASCSLTKNSLAALRDVNPLRSAHPLLFEGLPDLRSAQVALAPRPPASSTKSAIKIGLFDGGVDLTVPHLQGHVEEDVSLSIKTPPDPAGVAHGTAVAGAILYGELNGIAVETRLPPPPVSVVSFRVLPTSDPKDLDLYEAIDVIEEAVPARKDIKVFNLSFGPRGPILDDTVSRFTFALDSLSVAHKVAFVVAVGNDGATPDYDRIQSPADAVHGLGVGAFSLSGDKKVRAPYSCKGPGRECGKIKPDLVAFGGCENTPIHLLSTIHGSKLLNWGTSFAAPLVSRIGGHAAEAFDRSSPLLARALLVHSAFHPDGKPDDLLGHGIAPRDVNDILTCDDNSVTVIFQSDILPKSIVRLPIPWPEAAKASGKVIFRWTVAGLPPVDPNHPSDYTCGCLEDTFYPHDSRYDFTHPTDKEKKKTLDILKHASEVTSMLNLGWKQSAFPKTDSGNQYRSEAERRSLDCKWEPLVRRERTKRVTSIRRPFITLHAIGRNNVPDRFEYAVIVTVSALNYVGDLYTDIRNQFSALAPIRVRTEAEIRVQI
jgi:hypothetical protein